MRPGATPGRFLFGLLVAHQRAADHPRGAEARRVSQGYCGRAERSRGSDASGWPPVRERDEERAGTRFGRSNQATRSATKMMAAIAIAQCGTCIPRNTELPASHLST